MSIEWSTLKPKTKKLKFRKKKQISYPLVGSIAARDFRLIENRISAKSTKHKKAITYSFEAQIASHFFQNLKDIIS